MKKQYLISMVVFLFIISSGCILSLLQKDDTHSDKENRSLQTFPQLSATSFLDQSFQNQVNDYENDQFFARDAWTRAKTKFEYFFGKREFQDTYIGKEDMLFQKEEQPSSQTMKTLSNSINDFYKRYEQLSMSFLLAPNKSSIYEENMPSFAPSSIQKDTMNQFYKTLHTDIKTLDLTSLFTKNKDKQLYYGSDHHWTCEGAQLAANAWLDQNVKDKVKTDYKVYTVHDSFVGTLANKSGYIPEKKDHVDVYINDVAYLVNYVEEKQKAVSLYDIEKAKGSDPYSVFFGGNHPLIKIETTAENDRHLLVIKDSFANSFIPFLLADYHSITVVDPRYYYNDIDKLIKDNEINEVLFLYNFNTFFSDTSLKEVLK